MICKKKKKEDGKQQKKIRRVRQTLKCGDEKIKNLHQQ